jgi:hypothetical protein
MLLETYTYAVERRDEIRQALDERAFSANISRAHDMWAPYHPKETADTVAGIDSSWNSMSYQGFFLYAVDCVSILDDNSFLVSPRYQVNIGLLAGEMNGGEEGAGEGGGMRVFNPSEQLGEIGAEYEYQLAVESAGKVGQVLIDGSIMARLFDSRIRKRPAARERSEALARMNGVAFVSKTSESNQLFGGITGDMFFFNRASSGAGYSEPYYDERMGITFFYCRLADYVPCIKVEVPGRTDDVEPLIDALGSRQFDGYPYVLRLAHERCKISAEDMMTLSDTVGLNVEVGGRDVLGE